MKIASLSKKLSVGLLVLTLAVLAYGFVLPEDAKVAQVQTDQFQMQEPFSFEPLKFYSSLESGQDIYL